MLLGLGVWRPLRRSAGAPMSHSFCVWDCALLWNPSYLLWITWRELFDSVSLAALAQGGRRNPLGFEAQQLWTRHG